MYYIVKKNTDGVYLMDARNDRIYSTDDYDSAINKFNEIMKSKSRGSTYSLFKKDDATRYLTVIIER